MATPEPTRFARLQERYRQRDLPWDHELPPPEIRAAAERLAPGRVLDLGCGSARASIYHAARVARRAAGGLCTQQRRRPPPEPGDRH